MRPIVKLLIAVISGQHAAAHGAAAADAKALVVADQPREIESRPREISTFRVLNTRPVQPAPSGGQTSFVYPQRFSSTPIILGSSLPVVVASCEPTIDFENSIYIGSLNNTRTRQVPGAMRPSYSNQDRAAAFLGQDGARIILVADGNGKHGDRVAQFLIDNMTRHLKKLRRDDLFPSGKFSGDKIRTICQTIQSELVAMDFTERSGSTLTGGIVYPDGCIVRLNVGDSHSMLVTDEWVDQTVDHSVDDKTEQARVTKRHGVVACKGSKIPRVYRRDDDTQQLIGGLRVTRVFGQAELGNITSPDADTYFENIEPDKGHVLIVASDGIDIVRLRQSGRGRRAGGPAILTLTTAISELVPKIEAGKTPVSAKDIVEVLLEAAADRSSMEADDVTVAVLKI